jgi:hypothetical protein
VEENFRQAVKLVSDREIEIVEDPVGKDIVEDISSLLALFIDERGGQTLYVPEIPNQELRPIALKVRY